MVEQTSKVDDGRKDWHEKFSHVLWGYWRVGGGIWVETCHQKVLGSSCHCDQAGLLNYAKLKLEARLTLDHACSAVELSVERHR